MNKLKELIVDTDPGVDDALALALAFRNSNLKIDLITTVHGNIGVKQSTNNALKLLTFWGKKVPVAAGSKASLLGRNFEARSVHGNNGLGDAKFPAPDKGLLLNTNAVSSIHKLLSNSDHKISILEIAPLTNLAILLKEYPEDRKKISEIIMMGGSWGRGNAGIFSEFNVFNDPEAANIIFQSTIPLTIIPLEIGRMAQINKNTITSIKASGIIGYSISLMFGGYHSGPDRNTFNIYDALTVSYLLHPEFFTLASAFVAVEIGGKYTRGATVIDDRGKLKQPFNAKVAKKVDVEAFSNWFQKQW
ncbi:nucleoside hydrolase [Oenococcus oeni]|uniref:nucleoside hydrolase n=1 Tax=Oenococcus oeni TaxID=1247 RepID=UPI000277B47F|nr:nucleoside hydrolase [Oenococcus oeni]EJO04893.1 inosine-uridine nucleoside N-ribohydrolase [Oenococcus oeni AWRIB548]EJO08182.1 inosine-uridine nucleoside N-ribohydrolase [Oenococcus oeni AWRIB422]KEP86395.1 inosine-uridine nucleoside N-ribohydrolase [Oenococcus oeni IOEB_0205]KGH67978.1 nucleoside hydrolase [Oenococcus oeni IOEB_B16]OIL79860.1 nucleoside hydrolase [Oenococcus oeni]